MAFLTVFQAISALQFLHISPWSLVSTICSAVITGLSWLQFYGKISLKIRTRLLLLVTFSLVVAGLNFDHSNPFSWFNNHSIANLFHLVPSTTLFCWAFWRQPTDAEAIKLNFAIPLVFLIGVNAFYAIFDFTDLNPFDHSRHLGNALNIYNQLTSGNSLKIWEMLMYYDFYQPVAYISASPFFAVFGKSNTAAILCMVLFWLPLAYLYAWKTLRYLRFSPGVAALCCFLVLGGTVSVSLLKQFMQDFPVVAMLLVYQYWMIRSHFLKIRRWSLYAGFAFGLGLLTKASFLFLGLGSFIIIGLAFTKSNTWQKNLPSAPNVFRFLWPIAATAGIWFWVNRSHYAYTLPEMKNFAGVANLPPAGTLASWIWYWPQFPLVMGWPMLGVMLAGIYFLFKKKKTISAMDVYPILSIVLTIVGLSMVQNKDIRTILPLLAFCLLPAAWFFRNATSILLRPVAFTMLLWFVLGNFTLCYGWEWKWLPQLKPSAYVIENKPAAPDCPTPNRSYFTYQALFRAAYSDSIPPRLNFGENDNYHSRQVFPMLIASTEKQERQAILGSEHLVFCRNAAWPDHFFWSLQKEGSVLTIKNKGKIQQIDGDLFVELKWLDSSGQTISEQVINCLPGPDNWKTTIPNQAVSVWYGFKIHHSHPRGQWVQMVYDVLNRSDYQTFNIPLLIFKPEGNPVQTDIWTWPVNGETTWHTPVGHK